MGKNKKPEIIEQFKHDNNTIEFIQVQKDSFFFEYTVLVNNMVVIRTMNFDEEQYTYAERSYEAAVRTYKILNGIV